MALPVLWEPKEHALRTHRFSDSQLGAQPRNLPSRRIEMSCLSHLFDVECNRKRGVGLQHDSRESSRIHLAGAETDGEVRLGRSGRILDEERALRYRCVMLHELSSEILTYGWRVRR